MRRSGRVTKRPCGPSSPRSSKKIPAQDLAIQWDCSTEVQDAYGNIPGYPLEGSVERNLAEVRNLSPDIPSDVGLGYDFVFGTLGGWPRFRPDDLGQVVQLANGFVAASGRRVDWIYPPILDCSDHAFFAPLKTLQPDAARVYLGMFHNMANFKARLQTARRFSQTSDLPLIAGFGRVTAVCNGPTCWRSISRR